MSAESDDADTCARDLKPSVRGAIDLFNHRIDGISTSQIVLGTISCRALRDGPSPPLQRVLLHELRDLWLRGHGVQPSRDCRRRDV